MGTVNEHIIRHAIFSDCRKYRYCLTRAWSTILPPYKPGYVNFIMLNPSTADDQKDDPTIRRCMGFTRRWGFAGLHVTNLFGLRATDPKELRRTEDPHGPRNQVILATLAQTSSLVVCAWGNGGELGDEGRTTAEYLREAGVRLNCLGRTATGQPRHPLYVRSDTELEAFE